MENFIAMEMDGGRETYIRKRTVSETENMTGHPAGAVQVLSIREHGNPTQSC